jgi:hypothetical protein
MLPQPRRNLVRRRSLWRLRISHRRAELREQQATDLIINLARYAAVAARYDLAADLQWRLPTTVLTVESFVYLGLVTVGQGHEAVHWLLGVLGFLLGLVGAASMRRLELTSIADRILLDVYEELISEAGRTVPVIPHRSRSNDRPPMLRALQDRGAPA